MIEQEKYSISKLTSDFVVNSFDCGSSQINSYLKLFALVNQDNNLGKTWVLHQKEEKVVIGYYTISNASVSPILFPTSYTKNLPRYPIPCALIGKLGVDKKFKILGLGKYLLFDSLQRIKSMSNNIGCNAVIIEAVNDKIADFYEYYGFIRFKDKRNNLFYPVSSIPS